jgi:retron-type reverse transcriptase
LSALRDIYSAERIVEFWNDNKSKFPRRTAPGIDLVTRDKFSETLRAEAELIATRMAAGAYDFKYLRPIAIPKPGSSAPRIINVPTIRDRLVQRMLVAFLIKNYGSRWRVPHSFSSMGGQDEGVQATVIRIAKRIQPASFVIKADLSKYFDTIPRVDLSKSLRKLVKHRSLWTLIDKALSAETHFRDREHRDLAIKGELRRGVGVRQGMPISPLAAYLYLLDVDKLMSQSDFYRYVDDMVFISESKSEVTDAFTRYKELAETRGLKIHPLGSTKTQLVGPNESFEFLGIKLDRTGSTVTFKIPQASKVDILESALAQARIDPSSKKKQKGWLISAVTKTSQLTRSFEGAYGICSDWPQFKNELRVTQLAMSRRIADQLGELRRSKDDETLRRVFGI